MTKELNTLSTKKWENDYSGVTPTIDVTDGILVGDVAVDTSTSPYYLWRCLDNTDGAPVWIRIKSTANAEQSVTYGSSIDINLALGNVVKVGELTGNITVNNPTNPTTAEEVFIRFVQDGVGSRTVTLGSDYVLLDTNSNYPSGANEVFWFSGMTQSDGTIEGGFSPVDASVSIVQGDVTQESNTQTGTTYTLVDADHGKLVTLNNASAITLTVPSGLRSDFECAVLQLGAGQATFTASSTTLNNRSSYTKTAGQYALAGIRHYATNTFVTTGDMA